MPEMVSGSGLVDGAALAFEVGCIRVGGRVKAL